MGETHQHESLMTWQPEFDDIHHHRAMAERGDASR
jgi:hypothetical protein